MKPIIPMEPSRSDSIPQGQEWVAQVKWDGVRVLTYYDGREVRLYNRKMHERTLHYPEIIDIHSYCDADSVILDGEIIALGSDGKPSFHEVMRRDGIRRMEKVAQAQKRVPVTYMIFDVIYKNGIWLNQRPLIERIKILSDLIQPNDYVQLVSSHDDGQALFHAVRQHGMEGIVMKKTNSPYRIGKKDDVWLKIKNYRDLIAVVGGFTLSGGMVNAVLLGLYDEQGRFWYIGHAGTGKLTQQDWRELTERLKSNVSKDRPFVNKPDRSLKAYWVKPALTAKIKYAEWTEGHSLRQPSIQAFVHVPAHECKFSPEMFS
ncbi:non-homologous end-joining DNA ligase [Lihuaxuella thermophila]|uniref:DNA ligase (ATP) n=1 Tax=Lihuaxuella thermophila TaxID=1173111 RepID=A0A1H8FCU8_9BACL|nr:non-homologous end-joining DNA ligase [Lihuaxuella thermophila]SEN29542.1 bifunctional non-homologous end joining protein LigD [Lihuaxuella thermophila]